MPGLADRDRPLPPPWSRLAPVDIALLIDSGVPAHTISADGDVDVEYVRRHGWVVTDQSMYRHGAVDEDDDAAEVEHPGDP